jgi:ADP-heptose:LPS heptosyltransferase
VIVLRACALGDLVLTGPLLHRIEEAFLVAHGEHVELARAAGWVGGGLDADLAGLHALYSPQPDPARLAAPLRERLARAESVLVLGRPGARRDTLLRGLRASGAGDLHAHDPLPPAGVHAADHLARAFPGAPEPAQPRIALSERVLALREQALARAGIDPGARLIALHPGAGSPAKCWPAARWAELWRALGCQASAVVICGPADLDAARELSQDIDSPVLTEPPLPELAAVLAGCAALLGHDSGISHLSAALGVPTLALFGPTDPLGWAPRGPRVSVLQAPDGELARLDVARVSRAARELVELDPAGSAAQGVKV